MPYTAFPGHPVRRLQAVGLRPRARHRHARPLSRDEGRDREHRPEADQPVRAVARAALPLDRARAGHVRADQLRRDRGRPAGDRAGDQRPRYDLSLAEIGVVLSSHWLGHARDPASVGLPDRPGRRADRARCRAGRLRPLPHRGRAGADVLAALRAAVPRRRGRGERELRDRSRGDGLVRRLAARTRSRDPAGGGPVGGLIGALVLPQFTVHHAYVFLGGFCLPGRRPERCLRSASRQPFRSRSSTWSGAPRSPAVASLLGQRPLRRGADVVL